MAIHTPGPTGKFSGKIGNIVLSSWRGLSIGRAAPNKSRKKTTLIQLENRLRFSTGAVFSAKLSEAIAIGYPSNKGIKTAMNVAQQHNIKQAITGIYPNLTINHSQIHLSSGSLAPVYRAQLIVTAEPGNVKITWENPVNFKLGVEEQDTIQVCLYNESTDCVTFYKDKAFRVDREMTFFTDEPAKGIFYGWMFLLSADGKRASATQYLGKHEIQ